MGTGRPPPSLGRRPAPSAARPGTPPGYQRPLINLAQNITTAQSTSSTAFGPPQPGVTTTNNRYWEQILTVGDKSVWNRLNGRLGGPADLRGRPALPAARPPGIAARPR
jgi:hypothetical protein